MIAKESSASNVTAPRKQELEERLKREAVESVRVEWCDIHGIARGKRVALESFVAALEAGIPFSSASMSMGLDGEVLALPKELAEAGWPNLVAHPDLATLQLLPHKIGEAQVLANLCLNDGRPLPHSPRQVLQRVIEKGRELGLRVEIGVELEFYLFQEESPRSHPPKAYLLKPGRQVYRLRHGAEEEEFLRRLRQFSGAMEAGIEVFSAEDGPGQFEITTGPSEPVSAADTAFKLKSAVKEIAGNLGLVATFMSKPLAEESGSGMHLHQNLSPQAGGGGTGLKSAVDLERLTDHFIAGELRDMSAAAAFYLPTVNSYKRVLTRGQGPLGAVWGKDNRSVALRVLESQSGAIKEVDKERRVENRVPGAEANPYLAIAASLATGFAGVVEVLRPPKMIEGNAYLPVEGKQPLPRSLSESLSALSENKRLEDWLGEGLVQLFLALKQNEVERFEKTVTDWEMNEYLEWL